MYIYIYIYIYIDNILYTACLYRDKLYDVQLYYDPPVELISPDLFTLN